MARFIFGGEVTHLGVEEDATNANAFKRLTPGTAMPWRSAPGGSVVTDFLLWDGSAFTIAASSIVADGNGYCPVFQGPDGVSVLYDANGYALVARDAGTAASDWSTIANKPAFVAAGTTQALARDAIAAASVAEMTTTDAQDGTGTTAVLIEPAVLKAGIQKWAPSNVYYMPIWDGNGAHPLRPTLPAGFRVHWFQPTAPLTTTGYAVAGFDLWTATA